MKNYKLTQAMYERLQEAAKPVPIMWSGAIEDAPSFSPQENVQKVWDSIGEELGFKPETVAPVREGEHYWFKAEPIKRR